MEEKIYYVYAYVRLDTNTYFYIGKGKDNRYLRLDNRKQHFMNIFNKVPCVVEILKDNLTEDEAFQLEVDTIYDLVFNEGYSIDIKGIKRNDNDCHLVNCTWGGEGTSGLSIKQSQETIDKRVAKNIGQKRTEEQKQHLSEGRQRRFEEHPEERERLKTLRVGFVTSDETKQKLSELKGTKVRCIELDIIFPSIKATARYMLATYKGIQFNWNSLNRYLKGATNKDHYGEIEINGELVKLHWEYC